MPPRLPVWLRRRWSQGRGHALSAPPGRLPDAAKAAGTGPIPEGWSRNALADFGERRGGRGPRGGPRGCLRPAHRRRACLLTSNIGSGRQRGQRVSRAAGAGQSAAESPGGGAVGPAPCPLLPGKQGAPLPRARVCIKRQPCSLPWWPTARSAAPCSSAGTWGEGRGLPCLPWCPG